MDLADALLSFPLPSIKSILEALYVSFNCLNGLIVLVSVLVSVLVFA